MKRKKIQKEKLAARLAKYSAAAGAVIAVAPSVDAQVAYSGDPGLLHNTLGTMAIDMDDDGSTDFNFGLTTYSYSSSTYYSSAFISNPASNSWIGSNGGNPEALSTSYVIQSSLPTDFWRNNSNKYNLGNYNTAGGTNQNDLAPFASQGEQYIGVRFEISGSTHYGWIRVDIPAQCNEITFVDWAYNTIADEAITPGVPAANISTAESAPVTGDFNITIKFSESMTLTGTDLTLTNCSVSNLSSADGGLGLTYTATITPTATGDVTVALEAGAIQDGDANDNYEAESLTIAADLGEPTVALSTSATEPVGVEFDITITFNEAVTVLEESEINVTNGEVKAGTLATGDNTVYTATISPTTTGAVTISLPSGVAQDGDGYDNFAAPTDLEVTADLDVPTVNLSTSATEPVTTAFDITITFSEATSGLEESEITVTNGSVNAGSLSTSDGGITYTATITPTATGNVTIALPSAVAQDVAGNDNEAATNLVVEADLDAPTISITSSATEPVTTAFDITITFSEATSGLEESEIMVTNGSVNAGSLSTSDGGIIYTATITPDGNGDITIAIAGGVAQDAAGNQNTAASSLTVQYDAGINSIDGLVDNKKVLAYPNPTSGSMKIKLSNLNTHINSIVVTELSGKVILSKELAGNSAEIDLSSCKKGMYLLLFKDDNAIKITKKIVVK